MSEGINLLATVSSIKTTVDGGWKVTFDIGNDESQKVLQISQFRDVLVDLCVKHVDFNKSSTQDLFKEIDLTNLGDF